MFKRSKNNTTNDVPRRRQPVEDDASRTATSSQSQYRRNQTLSSYSRETPAPSESERHKAHTLVLQRRRIGGAFTGVFILVILLGLLLWQLIAQVRIVASAEPLMASFDAAPYEQSISKYLAINPAQRLRFSLDTSALSSYVATEHPEVENLSLTGVPGLAQSNMSITFRTPVAGWRMDNRQYYVDDKGVVFEKNYYDAPSVQIVDESGVDLQQGSATVGTRLLGFLGQIVSEAQGRGYTVTQAVLPAEKTRQVDIYVSGVATRVKLSVDRGAGEQIEDMDRSLDYLQSRGTTAEYIDVRVSGRAAYK